MSDIRRLGDAYLVTFENYRGRVPLLERKVGDPVNPAGVDLWILCPDEASARSVERYPTSINEYVTAARRHSFEALFPLVPTNAAVIFSSATSKDFDDAQMRKIHGLPRGVRFVWNNGSYQMEAETTDNGRYSTRSTRVGRGDIGPEEFRARAQKALARLRKRAPFPFADDPSALVMSRAALDVLARATAPAAHAARWWLDRAAAGSSPLKLTAASFTGAAGVRMLQLSYTPDRIRSEITYLDGSVLSDLGLRVRRPIPATAAYGSVGLPASQVIAAEEIGPWPIVEASVDDDGTFFSFSPPVDDARSFAGLSPLAEDAARQRLAGVLRRDLYDVPAIAPLLEARMAERPARLRASTAALYTLKALPAEVAAHVLEETLSPTGGSHVDLSPWLGEGEAIERSSDQIDVRRRTVVDLFQSILMPGEAA